MKLTKHSFLISILIVTSSCVNNPNVNDNNQTMNLLWSHEYEIIDAPSAVPKVIQNNFLIYTGSIGLKMIDITDGKLIWKNEVDDNRAVNTVSLLLNREKIFTVDEKKFKGWDIKTGKKIFQIGAEENILLYDRGRNEVFENGYALIGDTLDLYVLEEDGNIKYTIDIPFATNGVEYYDNRLFLGQFKTVTGALTLGRITALDAQTGDSLWAFDTDQGGFTWAAPIVEDGVLYASTIGNSSGEIAIALDAETGEELWRQTNEIFTFNSALGPTHYYINTSGSLAALNKQTGAIEWRVDWEGSDFNKPVYLAGYVYHVRDKEMLIINDADGEVVHHEPVPDGTYFWHVAASNDKIFAQTSRQLIAYQPWHLMVE